MPSPLLHANIIPSKVSNEFYDLFSILAITASEDSLLKSPKQLAGSRGCLVSIPLLPNFPGKEGNWMENQVIHALISTEEYRESPDFMNVNLSVFALFLATVTCPQRSWYSSPRPISLAWTTPCIHSRSAGTRFRRWNLGMRQWRYFKMFHDFSHHV